jgi:NADPH-dependent glutamate synthase beta subunit-like oxidoreductase
MRVPISFQAFFPCLGETTGECFKPRRSNVSYAENFKTMRKGFDLSHAVAEADRCLMCHDAPCSKACPAGTDPGAFIRKLRLKNITGAIRTIKENNILGGACGVLCPTARLCEEKCSARMASDAAPGGDDRPIQIGGIQRCLIEHAWETGFNPLDAPEPTGAKVAVVGSGPSGLSCAAELAKSGYRVTIFEARPEPGGVLRYGVVSYRFDLDFLAKELADVTDLGVEIICNSPIDAQRDAAKLLEEGYEAVFIGTGLWGASRLKKPAPNIEGVFTSVDYLSALRDGRFDQMVATCEGKTVAVVGGGSVAMDCVESAVKLGAKDVYLVYRRSYAQMPAEEDERLETLSAGVHYLLLNQPVNFDCDDAGRVQGLKMVRTRLGDADASGRRKPEAIDGSDWTLECDVVIEAIGNTVEAGSDQWFAGLDLTDRGLIAANADTGATSVPGIFAGGDIVRGPALVVNAVQDGKLAAWAIGHYLRSKEV